MGGAEQIYVYRRGRSKPFVSGIDRAAAQGYFYSRFATDGSRTLDDEITDYERRLGELVNDLRAGISGGTANALVAAEIVAHLTTRNAHLRGAFTEGLKSIVSSARTQFCDQDNLLRVLGLDEAQPGARFRERLKEILDPNSIFAQTGLPRPVLERLAFFFAKENLESATNETVPPLLAMLQELERSAPAMARHSHNKALSTSFAPDTRVAKLGALHWSIEATTLDLVLPDCVALGLVLDGTWHPLMMADPDEIQLVAMPLSAHALLVGRGTMARAVAVSGFNAAAVACSQTYFLCGSKSEELQGLLPTLGSRALNVIEDAVRDGVYELLSATPAEPPKTKSPIIQPQEKPGELAPPKVPRGIAIVFRGDFDEVLRERMAEATAQIVAEACWTIPLDRLDGITFADDYAEALRTLDRGFPAAKPVETHQTETGIGIAQAPTVLRDGVVKGHVVINGAVARHIIGEDDFYRPVAVRALVNKLALVGCTEVFDRALPGILLKPFRDGLDHDLQACVWPGWHGYFAARVSAAFNPAHSKLEAEVLANGLRDAQTAIPAARLAYREHGDLEGLMREVLPRIAFVLEHAGDLLGHADGLGSQPLSNEPELAALLGQMGLRKWIERYHRQLAELWDRRGDWDGFDEFLALNPHAERLLWQFGIFPWRSEEGHYRIEIPLATDAAALIRKSAEAVGELPQAPEYPSSAAGKLPLSAST